MTLSNKENNAYLFYENFSIIDMWVEGEDIHILFSIIDMYVEREDIHLLFSGIELFLDHSERSLVSIVDY
jgi:hypothetical protein